MLGRGVVFVAMMVSVYVPVIVVMASRWSRLCKTPAGEQVVCSARGGVRPAGIGRTVGQDANQKLLRVYLIFVWIFCCL